MPSRPTYGVNQPRRELQEVVLGATVGPAAPDTDDELNFDEAECLNEFVALYRRFLAVEHDAMAARPIARNIEHSLGKWRRQLGYRPWEPFDPAYALKRTALTIARDPVREPEQSQERRGWVEIAT